MCVLICVIENTCCLECTVHLIQSSKFWGVHPCGYCLFMSDSLWLPWTVACQTPLSMEFSRQECWSGLPFPSPGEFPDPGIKPVSFAPPELAGGFFTNWAIKEALFWGERIINKLMPEARQSPTSWTPQNDCNGSPWKSRRVVFRPNPHTLSLRASSRREPNKCGCVCVFLSWDRKF